MAVDRTRMMGKICLVTGSSSGIGKHTALGLAQLGATVVLVARDTRRGQAALAEIINRSSNDQVHLLLADISSQRAVRALAKTFRQRFSALHVLVNNAAIIPQQRELTVDGLEMQLAVNHLAGFLLTNLLLDLLKKSVPSRVVNVSSGVHRGAIIPFDDLQQAASYHPTNVYAQTKLANILFTYELARRLDGSQVTANCLHPGVIPTRLNAHYMGRSQAGDAAASEARRGAETSIYLASSPEVADSSGRYYANMREQLSSPLSHDKVAASRLWRVSESLTGIISNPSGENHAA